MTQYLDDKLIIKILKKEMFYLLILSSKNTIKGLLLRNKLLKSKEAEDVVQEVFLNLWKCRDQINEYYVFSKYLFKITYNATCTKFRQQASDKKQMEEALQNILIEDTTPQSRNEYIICLKLRIYL
jgi:DNA-directed RNA polymerase specialized sigma24 family protein